VLRTVLDRFAVKNKGFKNRNTQHFQSANEPV